MDDIRIVESLEKSGLLNDGATETVKREIKKTRSISFCYDCTYGCFIDSIYGCSLIQSLVSSLINAISGKGQEVGSLPLLTLPLMMKVLGKGVTIAGRGYNKIDQIDKNF